MGVVADYINSFWNAINSIHINLFGYSFSLWDMFFASCVFGICGYIIFELLQK